MARIVLIAGATGGVGRLVVRELVADGYATDNNLTVRCLVRNEEQARQMLATEIAGHRRLGEDPLASIEFVTGDCLNPDSLTHAFEGVIHVICTIGARHGTAENNGKIERAGVPQVEHQGVANLAAASKRAGVQHFVLVSSLCVTRPSSIIACILNSIANNVLVWKLRGENALRRSGVPFTIVRPGGLTDTGVSPPQAIRLGQGDTLSGRISRADVADICVACLAYPEQSRNTTFECVAAGKGGGEGLGVRKRVEGLGPLLGRIRPEPPSALNDRPDWQLDNEVPQCSACNAQFGFFVRRHHCRMCGNLYCGTCAANRAAVPQYGIFQPVRVCAPCKNKLQSEDVSLILSQVNTQPNW